jgi:hypothetical protein
MHYKNHINWRQIFKGPEFEYCSGTKFMESILPLYAVIIKWIKKSFPSLNTECPLKSGPFYVTNFTDSISSDNTFDKVAKPLYDGLFLNGAYLHTIKFYTKTGPMVFMFVLFMEHRDRLGDENF